MSSRAPASGRHTPATRRVDDALGYAMSPRLAVHYERHLVAGCGYRSHLEVAELALQCGADRGRWLDLGAGPGLVGKALAAAGSAADLVAVDISDAMLELIDAPIYLARLHADCTSALPVARGSFAGALAAGLMEHLDDPSALFREMGRALAPGGQLLFTYPPKRNGGLAFSGEADGLIAHEVSEIHEALARTGFTIWREREYPAYRNGSEGDVVHRLVACMRRGDPHREGVVST